MLDPPRKEVPAALQKCRGAGIRVFMLTGDFGLTARYVFLKSYVKFLAIVALTQKSLMQHIRTIAEDIGLITKHAHFDDKADDTKRDIEQGQRPTSRVIEGVELDDMSEEELSEALDIKELVFARISPAQKLQIVKALQRKGQVVTVTGDGVNDAPALKNADMGVSMGINGNDVAKEVSG